jgi:AraC family transcriptional regulator
MLWNCEPEIKAHSVVSNRDTFSHEVETSPEWVFLCAETGYFWFKIGSGHESIEGECHPGEWVLCPAGRPFKRKILSRLDFQVARLNFSFEPEIRGKVTPRDYKRTLATLAALRQCSFDSNAKLWKQHLFQDLFRSALWERQFSSSITKRDLEMEKVANWLALNLDQPISMARVAATVRLSPVAFTRRFRAALRQNPSDYLLEKRLDRARNYLLESDDTLEHIASRCGFSSGFYLSRQWKQRFGGTPSHFRRENRI